MFGFFKVATVRKLPNVLVDSYLALSNGVVMHLDGTTNAVTRLTPTGTGATVGDLSYVTCTSDGKYIYWSTARTDYKSFLYKRIGNVLTQLTTPGDSLQGVCAFSPDNKKLITNASVNEWRVNDDDSFTAYSIFPWGSTVGAGALCWSSDSNYVGVSCNQQNYFRLFRCNSATLNWTEMASVTTLPTQPVRIMNVGGYSFIVFFNTTDAPQLWTWNSTNNTWSQSSLTGISTRSVTDVAQTPDGAYLAISHNGGADYYKKLGTGSYQLIGTVPGVTAKALSVAWTLDGKFLALGMANATPALRFFVRSGDVLTQVSVPGTIGGWTNSGQVNHLAFS
jgi:WD40 repeat protein